MAMTDEQRAQALAQIPQDTYQAQKPNAFGDAAAAASNPGMKQVTTGGQAAAPVPAITRSLASQATSPAAAPTPAVPGRSLASTAFGGAQPSNQVRYDPASNSYSGGNVGGNVSINGSAPIPGAGLAASAFASPPVAAAPAQGQSLVDRALTQPAQPPVAQFNAPQVAHSGNDWEARNNLRNAEVSASSITNNGGRFSNNQGRGLSLAQLAYQDAARADLTARGEQPRLDMATTQVNAGLQKEGMEQAGQQQRSLVQAALGQQSNLNDMARAQMAEDGANQRSLVQFALGQQGNATELEKARIAAQGTVQAAQTKAAASKQPPAGYRTTPDGNLQAIPGGPADPAAGKEALQQAKDSQDVFSILDQARPLLDTATGSVAGNAFDKSVGAFGYSTEGANAAAQLKALQGAIVSKMPKMSGPQSDKDVQLYQEMAGRIGDATVPVEQRSAAMKTIEDLQMKYLPVASDAAAYQALQSGSYYKTPDGAVRRKQ